MNQKKRIKKLEADIVQLKKVVQNNSITLTDASNPKVQVKISLNSNVFLTEKITTSEKSDIITRDQSN